MCLYINVSAKQINYVRSLKENTFFVKTKPCSSDSASTNKNILPPWANDSYKLCPFFIFRAVHKENQNGMHHTKERTGNVSATVYAAQPGQCAQQTLE